MTQQTLHRGLGHPGVDLSPGDGGGVGLGLLLGESVAVEQLVLCLTWLHHPAPDGEVGLPQGEPLLRPPLLQHLLRDTVKDGLRPLPPLAELVQLGDGVVL